MALNSCTCYRLLGDKSPFSQQNLQGDALDRDEETARIQCKSFHSPFKKIPHWLVFSSTYKLSLWLILWFVLNSVSVYHPVQNQLLLFYVYSSMWLMSFIQNRYIFFHDYWHMVNFSCKLLQNNQFFPSLLVAVFEWVLTCEFLHVIIALSTLSFFVHHTKMLFSGLLF